MDDKPNYYAVIPASVRYDKGCPPAARLLYGEISALSNKEGYCWASNEYFARLYEVDTSTASSWVSSLVDGGHITVEVSRTDGNRRKIWLVDERRGVSGKSRRGVRKKPETSPGKSGEGSPGKAGENTPSGSTPIIAAPTFKVVTDLFWEGYQEECHGAKPLYKAQYTDWAGKIWRSAGQDRDVVAACVRAYFKERWYFTEGKQFDFGSFYQNWNKILSHVMAKRAVPKLTPAEEDDARYKEHLRQQQREREGAPVA